MVPGGPVETRDFSHINASILSAFNIFLTALGMVSLFLPYFIYKQQNWAIRIAFLCGISYLTVFGIDLIKLFPKSPTPMPVSLLIMEVLGIILSIPLIYYSIKKMKDATISQKAIRLSKMSYLLIGVVIIIALFIIIFATNAAMTSN